MAANVTSRSKLEHVRVAESLSEALGDCSMVHPTFIALKDPSVCICLGFVFGTKNSAEGKDVDDRPLDSHVAVECCAFLTRSLPICASHLQSH